MAYWGQGPVVQFAVKIVGTEKVRTVPLFEEALFVSVCPPKLTVLPVGVKPLPAIATAVPADPDAGEMEVITGAEILQP